MYAKLYTKYVMSNLYCVFIKNLIQGPKNLMAMVSAKASYFAIFHYKFSTNFYSSQLADMMCYELPLTSNPAQGALESGRSLSNGILVYNFHNLTSQDRVFLFVTNLLQSAHGGLSSLSDLNSVTELFPNASWLEREIAELHGLLFGFKRDVRNLMLQYGDNSAPFQKSFPAMGIQELFYDARTDSLSQRPVDHQN